MAVTDSPYLPCRDLCPALSELQCLQTLVSNITPGFSVVSREGVNLVPAVAFGDSLNREEHL